MESRVVVSSVFVSLLLVSLLESCSAQQSSSTVISPMLSQSTTPTAAQLYCYQCNSAGPGLGFNQSTCANNDVTSLQPYLLPCVNNIYRTYTRCRKMIQNVNGVTVTIRQCATAGTAGDGSGPCTSRSGTQSISITYCECKNLSPSQACNHGYRVTSLTVMTSLLLGALIGLSLVWQGV